MLITYNIVAIPFIKNDFYTASDWCTKWLISLNAKICTILHISKSNPYGNYGLKGINIGAASSKRPGLYIEIWSEHSLFLNNIAKQYPYLIQKGISQMCTTHGFKIVYECNAHSVLEFAGPAWCPQLVRDVNLLEYVLCRFTIRYTIKTTNA